jgi:hypothetical protein
MLQRLVAQVHDLEMVCSEQQAYIDRLIEVCVQRLDTEKIGRHLIYTRLIDKVDLKPLTSDSGSGEIVVPTTPIHIDNDNNGSALLDTLSLDLTKVDDVTFAAPMTIVDPWIGMFDVVTHALLVIYKFSRLTIPPGGSLHVTFKSKMVTW